MVLFKGSSVTLIQVRVRLPGGGFRGRAGWGEARARGCARCRPPCGRTWRGVCASRSSPSPSILLRSASWTVASSGRSHPLVGKSQLRLSASAIRAARARDAGPRAAWTVTATSTWAQIPQTPWSHAHPGGRRSLRRTSAFFRRRRRRYPRTTISQKPPTLQVCCLSNVSLSRLWITIKTNWQRAPLEFVWLRLFVISSRLAVYGYGMLCGAYRAVLQPCCNTD